jgi:hypothetical protein
MWAPSFLHGEDAIHTQNPATCRQHRGTRPCRECIVSHFHGIGKGENAADIQRRSAALSIASIRDAPGTTRERNVADKQVPACSTVKIRASTWLASKIVVAESAPTMRIVVFTIGSTLGP